MTAPRNGCVEQGCATCDEDCEERIAQARRERDESAGRHKTAMARKSRVAQRIKSTSGEHPVVKRPEVV